jgi:RHS repeat-associated protein
VASAGADYRYGYNGMEEEDRGDAVSSEIASTGAKAKPGEANLLNTEFRLYDPRLGQWLTRDPVFQPWESPYSAMAGNPILFSDPLGLDEGKLDNYPKDETGAIIGGTTEVVEVFADRTPESVIANDNSFYDFLNKNRVSIPSVNNSTISSPSPPSFYQRIIREWNDFNNNLAINTTPYGGGAAVQFGSRILYSSLDALQVTTSNLFHKLHLQNRSATHLDGSYANDNEVQAGFFSLYMDLFPIGGLTRLAKSGKGVVKAVDNAAVAVVDDVAEVAAKGVPWQKISGIVRDAAKGKGNFGLGTGTLDEAMTAGKSWVGDGFNIASDGKTMISADGLRQFRPPSFKPKLGKTQANFEWRNVNQGQWQGNGHLDILGN